MVPRMRLRLIRATSWISMPRAGGMSCTSFKPLTTAHLDCVGATQLLPGMLLLHTRAFGPVGVRVGLGKNAAALRYRPQRDASYTSLQVIRVTHQHVAVFVLV